MKGGAPVRCPRPTAARPRCELRWGIRLGLVFEAYRLLYHSTLGLRVIKKKKIRSVVDHFSKGVGSLENH